MPSQRKIIHCDCDCFYAAIEVRDNPQLTGLPVAVGGHPQRRGVVATCNYEARKLGIHSAMASAAARKLCQDLIIIRPDMEKYRRASQLIHGIFNRFTNLIEPLSLDEAYLDVSNCARFENDALMIAAEIRRLVRDELGITVSVGIAPNKFLAKVASDWNKPDGQFIVAPDQVDEFVKQLPVKKMFGVGQVTALKLKKLQINTCGDLRSRSLQELHDLFGVFGSRLYELCRGIDERPVQTSRLRKSLSVENTYVDDLLDYDSCLHALPDLAIELNKRLARLEERYSISKQFVRIKFNNFVSTTVEMLSVTTDQHNFQQLLQKGFARGNRPVRLLGVGVKLIAANPENFQSQDIETRSARTRMKTSQLFLNLD
ncbi:MAG: DNA polymerase IV [Pseudohongiellaceae bacterium]